MGSLPPRLALVCNVFMYVFVNVIEVLGEWGGGGTAANLSQACSPNYSPFSL